MDSSRRRLPSWMLGTTAPGKSSLLESGVESKKDVTEEPQAKPRRSTKPKLQVKQSLGEKDIQEREPAKETSFKLKKCEGKRGKRKATSDNGHKSDDDLERNGYPPDEEECQNPRSGGGCEDYGLEEDADEAFVPRSKVQSKKFSKVEKSCGTEPLEVNSCLLKKCKSKEIKRRCNSSLRDDNEEKENDAVTKRKSQSDALGKQRTKHLKEKPSCETEEPFLSDGDLTVEDLVSIAKMYVGKQRGALVCDSGLPPRGFSHEEAGRAWNGLEAEMAPLVDTSDVSHPKQPDSLPTKKSITAYVKTGDPAQDMLNLFLGPLLGMPGELEKQSDTICGRIASSYESSEQTQNPDSGAAVIPMKKAATFERNMLDHDSHERSQQGFVGAAGPSMKKKVSLKEKVAQLLD
ncbi:hypothetical protein Droror1_Dr00002846 [Drosera rotundifolia]